ncbi:DUF749 domain-containing protein [Methanothermococcus okinawensis]|uniref:DUF749 domain-containing protein n=1 Tax=Methanothermococcus okinawensis (strain DSM 14208 / JCM 11175 / IH1) TaxID=647113 RepID=F8AMT5_METOI|nr:DUF749 family protein [Methanothermococcus okinawensis]AEH06916.1 protein of unknown function DUF749 [Methanothermococcus okinawensis IH1]
MECNENTFTAKLISIISVEEGLKSELADCIKIRAHLDKRELNKNDKVAILNIIGTTSYQAFFMDGKESISYIKSKLDEMGTLLNHDSEEILKKYVERL